MSRGKFRENAHRLKPFAAWEAFGDMQLTQTRSEATGHSDQPLPAPKHPSRHKSETAKAWRGSRRDAKRLVKSEE